MKSPRLSLLILISAFIFIGGFAIKAKADNATPTPISINLNIEGPTSTIFNEPITVSACTTPNNATSTVNGFCAFASAGLPADVTWSSYGGLVNSINGAAGDSNNYWLWFLNGDAAPVGIDNYMLQPNDNILWALGREPLKVSLSTTTPTVNATTTVTVLGFNADNFDFEPVGGATIAGTASTTTDTNGIADIIATSTNPFSISVSANGFIPSGQFTITPQPENITDTSTPTNTPPSGGGGSGGGASISHPNFNIPNALSFISAGQNQGGSFSDPITTDWTAVAFGAEDAGTAETKLKNYLLNETPTLSAITDYERHAMALEALGINPYSGTSINYITAITNAFNGTQIGSADNADIFALIVLEHAGFISSDAIIQKEAAFVLSAQNPDGSWDETPDMTAAAIQALGSLFNISGVNGALGHAAGYLASTEKQDGGWGNIDSTSWAQTAINAIISAQTPGFETESPWTSSAGLFPTDALASGQQPDGGVLSANRIWSTGYAVVAASGKSWVTVLGQFPKPALSIAGGSGTNNNSLVTSTSTPDILTTATTTPETATSTQPLVAQVLTPVIKTPTASTTIILKPKTNPERIKIKKQAVLFAPTVLGASTTKPALSITTAKPLTTATSKKTNFFGDIWHGINSFFRDLFRI